MDPSYSTRPVTRVASLRRSRSAASRSVGAEINPRQAVIAAEDLSAVPPPQRSGQRSVPEREAGPDSGSAQKDSPRRTNPRTAPTDAWVRPESLLRGDSVASRIQRYRRPRRIPLVGRYEDLTV